MTPIDPGDVYLVPFPFTDQSAVKQRPAVVLSNRDYNNTYPDLILAPITGRITGNQDEVKLADWQSAGLTKLSVVKPLLASFEKSLLRRKLGRLSEGDLSAVRFLFTRILLGATSVRGRSVAFINDSLVVELSDGRTISVPLIQFPRLHHAAPIQRANWRWVGGGIGIHWEDVDEDIAVTTLLRY